MTNWTEYRKDVLTYVDGWHNGFMDCGIRIGDVVEHVASNVTAYFTGDVDKTAPEYVAAVKALLEQGTLKLYRNIPYSGPGVPHYFISTYDVLATSDAYERVTEGWL